jgi:hypothetical protein
MDFKQVQAAIGVAADGFPGPKTSAALTREAMAGNLAVLRPVQIELPLVAPKTTAMIYQGSAQYPVEEIVIHCTATDREWYADATLTQKIAEITRWHRARGFSTIGYHWVIDRDGSILPGRPETVIGAHVVEANRGTIGISLVGGFGGAATDRFEDHFTSAQWKTLQSKIADIRSRTQIKRITGHNQYAAKACPCFDVPSTVRV